MALKSPNEFSTEYSCILNQLRWHTNHIIQSNNWNCSLYEPRLGSDWNFCLKDLSKEIILFIKAVCTSNLDFYIRMIPVTHWFSMFSEKKHNSRLMINKNIKIFPLGYEVSSREPSESIVDSRRDSVLHQNTKQIGW